MIFLQLIITDGMNQVLITLAQGTRDASTCLQLISMLMTLKLLLDSIVW